MVFILMVSAASRLNLIKKHFGRISVSVFLSWLLYLSMAYSVFAQDNVVQPCSSEDEKAIRLAVVTRGQAIESRSLFKGVLASCQNDQWRTPINVKRYSYDNDTEGFEIVSKIVKDGSADVIIGPSESSLYADLVDFLKFEQHKIPIISPVVTVKLGNDPNDWFFRTNINAIDRAQAMHEFLTAKGVVNIALLYTDGTFGEISETAFKAELSEPQNSKYNSFRFTSVNNARPWVKQINSLRPEAIGIIGSRQEIAQIKGLFTRLHTEWNAFNPYFFTTVDTRGLQLDETYFLSVGNHGELEPGEASGELLDLSYDTTSLVLMITDDMLSRGNLPRTPDWPIEFRKRLVGAMSGSISNLQARSRTEMEFSDLNNIAASKVMTTQDNKVLLVSPSVESGWRNAINNWLEIKKRRYGIAPIVNISLITIIVVLLTIFDLKKSHSVSNRDLLRIPFISLVGLNVSIAILLFVYIAEMGILELDSVFGALLLAFGYSGLLKTTIFETETGKSIGLRSYYESLVTWIYDNIRRQQFEKVGPIINYIAYANSRPYLMSTLLESYGFAGDEERTKILQDNLQVELDKYQTMLGTRKVLAKEVFNEVSWTKLQERRIVPRGAQPQDLQDPEPIVDVCLQYCFSNNPDCLVELEKLVNEKLDNPQYSDLKDEFVEDLSTSNTPRAKIASCIRWIVLLLGYDLNLMVRYGLLPANYVVQDKKNPFVGLFKRKLLDLDKRATPRINDLVTEVDVTFDDKTEKGRVLNVSEGGIRIVFDQDIGAVPKDALITSTNDNAAIQFKNDKAKVMNHQSSKHGKSLLGFCWQGLNRQSRGNINAYLRSVLEA